MALPRSIMNVMRRQGGLVTRSQVLAEGIPSSTLQSWLRRGWLEAVLTSVYRWPGAAVDDRQHLRAALLRSGSGARLGGWSACALHGIEGFDLAERAWVTIPPERRVRGVPFIVHRTVLDRGEVATVGGLPGVTPVRALIDAAGRVSPRTLRVGIDDARRRGLVELDRLLRRATLLGRHRGATAVRRLFGSGALDQDGELERRLAVALAQEGQHPAWAMEVLPGVVVDACFPDASYVLECDGRRWHTIDADVAADVTREGLLRSDGWRVDRVTSADLRDDHRRLLARIIATRDARREAGLGRPDGWRPVHAGRRIRPPQ